VTRICRITLGNGIHLDARWTYDDQGDPVTVSMMRCARTGADAGQVIHSGHRRSEFVVTLAATINRDEAGKRLAPEPARSVFDRFQPPSGRAPDAQSIFFTYAGQGRLSVAHPARRVPC
jgi:hypothetical protein